MNGDAATVESNWSVIQNSASGPKIGSAGAYQDQVVKQNGKWLFRYGKIDRFIADGLIHVASDSDPTAQMMEAMVRQLVDTGMDPAMVAEQVLDAVRAERFWVLPNADDFGPLIKDVAESAAEGRNPPLAPLT